MADVGDLHKAPEWLTADAGTPVLDTAVDPTDDEFVANQARMRALVDELRERQAV